MKCAVAVVLALIGIAVANPVPSLGHVAIASPLLLPSAVSVQSSVINHGVTIPKVVYAAPVLHAPIVHAPIVHAPIVHAPIVHAPIIAPLYTSLGHSWGWGKGWH